jgi:Precorrin-6x reductase
VTPRLLILGGTADAVALARAAVERFGDRLQVITSLAGRLPRGPWDETSAGRLRIGGFGGVDGLANYLATERFDAVIDATHPFAATISAHAVAACAARGIPLLRLVRSPWERVPGDRWIDVPDMAGAVAAVADLASRVFLATGPGHLDAFADVRGVWFLVRSFATPPAPLPLAEYALLVARPPFTIDSETALLRAHAIGALVTKQSGGPTAAKLAAARALGLPVVMIARPTKPPAPEVPSVPAALAWLDAIG